MEEKRIKFTQLKITNFRNITDLTIDFKDDVTELVGKNGLGKTNTLSAIMWCLFGKDIYDNKLFTISPIIDGEEDNSINTIVKLVINGNYVIERSYKNRKTNLKTGWIIDGKEELVSITQTKYNQELEENFVDETTFKTLSNINYVPNLNWKDLKALIFDLIGNISDEEVLLRDDFTLIEEYVKKFGIDVTQKQLKETDSELNEDIKRLETEYQTLLNTKDKYVADSDENETLKARKKEIEDILYNAQQDAEKSRQKIIEFNEKIRLHNSLKNDIDNLNIQKNNNLQTIEDYKELYKNSGTDVEVLRKRELENIQVQIDRLIKGNEEVKNVIKNEEISLENIRKEGEELKKVEVKVENDTCITCGQKLSEEKIKSALEKLKVHQQERLLELKEQYEQVKTAIASNKSLLEEKTEELEKSNALKEAIMTKEYVVEDENEKQKEIRVRRENLELENKTIDEKLVEFNARYEEEEKEINSMETPTTTYIDTQVLTNELNDINDKLATSIALDKLNEDVESKLKELEGRRENKVKNKEKLQEVIKFNNIKADLLQQRVRAYFKLINFRTKEFNQNGDEVETFKICNDKGVEWKEVNTGQKILLGIDLLQGIMKAKNIYVPIIVDNFEALTSDIDTNGSQIITARAEKGKESLEIR